MVERQRLQVLPRGSTILVGGDKLLRVPDEVAERFRPGDAVVGVEATSEVLHIPAHERSVAERAVSRACEAFSELCRIDDERISRFFEQFAHNLESDDIWAAIRRANELDVADAQARGRSTTRLVASDKMRAAMAAGLRGWIRAPSRRGQVLERVEHEQRTVELVGAALGVVAFVFEGRPNVLADATGVLRGGNSVVFRIGRDALGTARALMQQALTPALQAAGLPEGAVCLVDSAAHAAGWALFCDARLSLAVARGSGPAVATLGALAQQAGTPVSLHGTGGAWIVAGSSAREATLEAVVRASLDRKVCNTLNTLCVVKESAQRLVPAALSGLTQAGERLGQSFKLHVVQGSEAFVPKQLFERTVSVRRAEGDVSEHQAELLSEQELGREWEWEQTPEISLIVVDDVAQAVELFNRYSPLFAAALVSEDATEHDRFYEAVNAPFVGDAGTRWIDGQVALGKPELGLSNWQNGRLFARGGILSGDSVYTVRTRARAK